MIWTAFRRSQRRALPPAPPPTEPTLSLAGTYPLSELDAIVRAEKRRLATQAFAANRERAREGTMPRGPNGRWLPQIKPNPRETET